MVLEEVNILIVVVERRGTTVIVYYGSLSNRAYSITLIAAIVFSILKLIRGLKIS